MIIKTPPCYDISHWKDVPDFRLIDPKPLLFITKATEAAPGTAYNHTDDKFVEFFTGAMSIGAARGAYHFNRKSVDGRKQAEHFINVISRQDILSSDLLILDVEEGGEKASQLWMWFEVVRAAYPDNLLMLYSRANVLNAITMTESEKAYFKKIYTWPAGYPYFPDLYTSIPKGYIPDQSKFGPAVLWQYSAHGKVTGIIGDVDLNLITPEFQTILENRRVIGDVMLINATGKCTNSSNKVWASIGGQMIGAFRLNDSVIINQEQTVSGVKYIHASGFGLSGWSKAQWFSYSVSTTPPEPPMPPAPPAAAEEYVLHVKDGVTRKFILKQ